MKKVLVIVSLFCLASAVDARRAKTTVVSPSAFKQSNAAVMTQKARTITGKNQVPGMNNATIVAASAAAVATVGVKGKEAIQGVVLNFPKMNAVEKQNANQWLKDVSEGNKDALNKLTEVREKCKLAA